MTDPQDRIAQLEARIAQLEGLNSTIDEHQNSEEALPMTAPTGSRRNLLKLAAGAAAGGTALAIANSSGRAAALDTDPIEVGAITTQGDSGRTTTVVRYENANAPQVSDLAGLRSANVMTIHDGLLNPLAQNRARSSFPAALGGYGYRTVPNGVYGFTSNGGAGVVAVGGGSGAIGLLARGNRANVELTPAGAVPQTRADAHQVGELVVDSAGDMWYCAAAGTPGSWRKLAGPETVGVLHPIAPRRVYDSRAGFEPMTVVKGKLNPGSNRAVDCTVDAPEVPSTAGAVVLNITAAGTTSNGNLAVYPDGTPAPTTSSLNYIPGVNVANTTTSGCGPDASIRVQCGAASAAGADFIIDIVGYYV